MLAKKLLQQAGSYDENVSIELSGIKSRLIQQARDTDIVAIQELIILAEGTVTVGESIGYALYPIPDNTEQDISKMVDTSMYAAKKSGQNRQLDRPLRRVVESEDGMAIPYDRLLIATGSSAIMLPVSGIDLSGLAGIRVEPCAALIT